MVLWFSQNIEKYMPIERGDRMHLFWHIFFHVYENHICQNLSQNDAIIFFTKFCTIIKYKSPNIWYLKFLFQLNVFIGCI